eukprot:gene5606-biopygen13251
MAAELPSFLSVPMSKPEGANWVPSSSRMHATRTREGTPTYIS